MRKLDKKGIGAVQVLIIVVVVGLIGLAGWYVINANDDAKPTQSNTTTSNTAAQTVQTKLIKIPELGIQFTVSGDLTGLTYKAVKIDYDPAVGSQMTAYLSTSELAKAEPGNCSIENPSAANGTIPPLGFLTNVPGTYPANATADNTTGPLTKQLEKSYVSLRSPGTGCFDNSELNTKSVKLFNQLTKELKTVTVIQ